MIRAAVISLALASPAAAATLHPVRILECETAHVAAGPELRPGMPEDWGRVVELVEICRWPAPFSADDLLALKDVSESTWTRPTHVARPAVFTPSAVVRSIGDGGAVTGGFAWAGVASSSSSISSAETSVFVTNVTHGPGCCCPACLPKDDPPAVPLPGAGWLLVAAIGALAWRARR